jgi:broad specificity phosphatase PhoE
VRRLVERHAAGLERALAEAPAGTRAILIVGHGCTADAVVDALVGLEHPDERHYAAVPHCGLTTLRRGDGGRWAVASFAEPTVATSVENNTPKL